MTGDGLTVTGTGVTVNATAGEGVDRAVLAESRLAELRAHTGADVVAVTLDTEGAVETPEPTASRASQREASRAAIERSASAGISILDPLYHFPHPVNSVDPVKTNSLPTERARFRE